MTVPALFNEFLPSILSESNTFRQCHCEEGEERCPRSIEAGTLEKGRVAILNLLALHLSDNLLQSLVNSLYCGQNHKSEASILSHFHTWKSEKEALANKIIQTSMGPSNNQSTHINDLHPTYIPSEGQPDRKIQFNTPINPQLPTPPSSRPSTEARNRTLYRRASREESPSPCPQVEATNLLPSYIIELEEESSLTSHNKVPLSQRLERVPHRLENDYLESENIQVCHEINKECVEQAIKGKLDNFKPVKLETGTNDNKIRKLARKPLKQSRSRSPSGYLYAMRNLQNRPHAVKVGSSNDIPRRKCELERESGRAKLEIVSRREEERLNFAKRAESLAHQLLDGYHLYPKGSPKKIMYQNEYFVVSDVLAQQAIDIASLFTRVAYQRDGNTIPFWEKELSAMAEGPAQEDLAGRLARWSAWLTRTERRFTLGFAVFWYLEVLAFVTFPIECLRQLVSNILQDLQLNLPDYIGFGVHGSILGLIVMFGALGEDLITVSWIFS